MSTENTSRMLFDRFFAEDDVGSALVEAAGGEFHRRHGGEEQAADNGAVERVSSCVRETRS